MKVPRNLAEHCLKSVGELFSIVIQCIAETTQQTKNVEQLYYNVMSLALHANQVGLSK